MDFKTYTNILFKCLILRNSQIYFKYIINILTINSNIKILSNFVIP